jgi:polyhydroxyalkanoate synthesis regulator phasin
VADKTTEYKTKSIYFTKSEFELLDKIVDKCKATNTSISDYFKELASEDMGENKKLPQYMEDRMIELIKQYAPTVNAEEVKKEIKEEIDPEVIAALKNLENMF